MKPTEEKADDPLYRRAAREKIASDLAFELGLPVPPVLLATFPPGLPACISLVMYPRQFAWEHIKSQSLDESDLGVALARALPQCGSMLAFDTWIKQMDHGDHPHNIVLGYVPGQLATSELVFLDFAFSMGFDRSWNEGGWRDVRKAHFPPLMLEQLDSERLEDGVRRIESLADETIATIIDRIPEPFLPRDQAGVIKEGLMGRKNLIRGVLSL